ncbi:hypothetical protein FHS15_001406 [Paenibacillus castaneae]|uniref:hypothetical protein n=1 Tax=Paenibacillus castaneae TaxID=474957 RepID=UPI000C9C3F9B|nr:hypothetical protein [Paenibacillus castaneae]NIK76299.1 hypothetical protein [Paenibacillus castaneae]
MAAGNHDKGISIQSLRRLLLRDDGAVTVFAVIVLSSLLLFFSLLIDYARIAAMHKLADDAVRSSVRSVLSAYDTALYEKYGLFGRGGTDGQTIFAEAMKRNTELEQGLRKQTQRMVQLKVEAPKLQSSAFLGNHDVFARQVLEEMKYKAPIDFTLELAARFAPMAGAMKEATLTVNLLESMRKLYEKREAHLARVLQHQQKAAAIVSGSGIEAMIPMNPNMVPIGVHSILLVANEYKLYVEQVTYDQSLPGGGKPKYTHEIATYEDKSRLLAAELKWISDETLKEQIRLQAEALKELEAARVLNEEMRQLVDQASQLEANAGYDKVSNNPLEDYDQHDVPTNAASELEQIKGAVDELILPDSWFTVYEEELVEQGNVFAALDGEAAVFHSRSSSSLDRPLNAAYADSLLQSVQALRAAYSRYEVNYIQPASVIMKRVEELENTDVKKKLKQQENQAGSLWKQARSMLRGFSSVPQSEEHTKPFDEVKKHFEANLLFNQQSNEAKKITASDQAKDAHEEAEQSTELMSGLFAGMGDMLERTRDSLYYGEYVVHHYTAFAPQNLRSMMKDGELEELSNAISFHNQEVEYIIYGFHNPIGNIAAAYGELFAVRLAVRTMEGLIESRSLGHPLLILSAALIYGLEKTMEDMLAFTNKGTAPLSKYVKVELSYNDYLRLFMLMHSADEKERLARMIAVIEQNSEATLSAVPSGVTGEVQVSAELWFVPGLMKVLGRFGLLEGKVVGNRYETTQTIGLSY